MPCQDVKKKEKLHVGSDGEKKEKAQLSGEKKDKALVGSASLVKGKGAVRLPILEKEKLRSCQEKEKAQSPQERGKKRRSCQERGKKRRS